MCHALQGGFIVVSKPGLLASEALWFQVAARHVDVAGKWGVFIIYLIQVMGAGAVSCDVGDFKYRACVVCFYNFANF